MIIKNKKELIEKEDSKKNKRGREIILELFEVAIGAVLPERLIRKAIKRDDNKIRIMGEEMDLESISRVYIIGGGKASGEMVLEVSKILGDRIERGVINVPKDMEGKYENLQRIEIIGAGHPVPTRYGEYGVRKMLEIINEATEKDLIMCLISGGGSALMTLPAEQIGLEDMQKMTEILLKSGMKINEINIIRKHCSKIKGGQLIKNNRARFITLILSDVLKDPLDIIASGPTVPDESTFKDVERIIKRYKIEEKLPKSIIEHIKKGIIGEIEETPKEGDKRFRKVKNYIIGNIKIACEELIKEAERYRIPVKMIGVDIEGEAREIGIKLIKELLGDNKPIILVGGGETTVSVKGNGMGGRNQELILSASELIKEDGIVIGAIGTDGIDGNTDAAGAIMDLTLVKKAKKMKLIAMNYLKNNDSYNYFKKVGDGLIYTGYTGTNVNDIYIFMRT